MDETSNKPFFINPVDKMPTWVDPRKKIEEPQPIHNIIIDGEQLKTSKKVAAGSGSITVAMVAVIPVILFILGAAARIYYLHVSLSVDLWLLQFITHA